jgi:hypothetical protein
VRLFQFWGQIVLPTLGQEPAIPILSRLTLRAFDGGLYGILPPLPVVEAANST